MSDIWSVNAAGQPSTTLESIQIVGTQIPTFPGSAAFFPLDFSQGALSVVPGEKLAVVLHATSGNVLFNLVGDQCTAYPGGFAQDQEIGNHSWDPLLNSNSDLGFATYVAVPEPASGGLLMFACSAVLRRRRK